MKNIFSIIIFIIFNLILNFSYSQDFGAPFIKITLQKNMEVMHKYGLTEENFVEFSKGDFLYLYSDVYTNLNNEERKKFKTSKLLVILQQNCTLSSEGKREVIENKLDKWQGNSDQRDDIAFVDLKII